MKTTLAFETSSDLCSVALSLNDKSWNYSERIGHGHAVKLFELFNVLLEEACLTMDDIDDIAVTSGPGSFTGVRIGLAALLGFKLSGKKVFSFRTFDLMHFIALKLLNKEAPIKNWAIPSIIVALDTRRGDYFTAVYEEGAFNSKDTVCSAAELKDLADQKKAPLITNVSSLMVDGNFSLNKVHREPCAFDLLALVKSSVQKYYPSNLTPTYIRSPKIYGKENF